MVLLPVHNNTNTSKRSYPINMQQITDKLQHFIAHKSNLLVKIFAGIAIFSVTVCAILGFRIGIDFSGGVILEYSVPKELISQDHHRTIQSATGIENFILQTTSSDAGTFSLRVGANMANNVENLKKQISLAYQKQVKFLTVDVIGPQAGKDLVVQSFVAVAFAFVSILLYMLLRFNWQFAVSGIVTLWYDVVVSIGFISVSRIEINLTTIAAILTIIGYCINDTVVIYDRIRTNLIRYINKNVADVIALSVAETLRRSIVTSVATMTSLIGIMMFSDVAIRGFALIVTFGIVVGTIGSIALASTLPIVLNFYRPTLKNKPEPKDPMFYAS